MKVISNIAICLKIIADVAFFRIKRKEMANLFAALSIMIALRNSVFDTFIRFVYGGILNILVYLINDFYDVELDLQSSRRNSDSTLFLKNHMYHALASIFLLIVSLIIFAFFYNYHLLIPLAGGAGLCWLYSTLLKKFPLVDIITIAICGGIMSAVGISFKDYRGWILVIQLALFSACFEAVQTLRDRETDLNFKIQTTAVFWGVKKTSFLIKFIILCGALYCVIFVHYIFGFCMFLTLLFPVEPDKMDRYWNRIRLAFGLVWIAILIHFYLTGSPQGLLYVKLPFK